MSGRLLSGAFKSATGDPHSKLVLIVMADAACDQGGSCTLSQMDLANRCQMSQTELVGAIAKLKKLQLISPTKITVEAFEVCTHNEEI